MKWIKINYQERFRESKEKWKKKVQNKSKYFHVKKEKKTKS